MTMTSNFTNLDALFDAKSIAVIGASGKRADATGNQVIRHLRDTGYTGTIHAVNPSGALIEGVQAVRSTTDLPDIDLAVVTLPPGAIGTVLLDLENAGCPAAAVLSVELTQDETDTLVTWKETRGMVVHGPNCMGVINVQRSMAVWADEGILTGLRPGDVSIVSQSGSGAIFVTRSAPGIGFAKIISTGNEYATSSADYISWLADDPDTRVIGLVLESISDAEAFQAAVAKARRAGKPLVALKVGRTEAGGRATVAHTGAILSSDSAYTALFERLDLPLVADYDELASSLEALSVLRSRTVAGPRVGVITISGGQAALTADLATARSITLPPFSDATSHELSALFSGATINNPFDAGAGASSHESAFGDALGVLCRDPSLDAVLVVADAQSSLSDREIAYEEQMITDVTAAAAAHPAKPVVIASSSSLTIHPSRVTTPDSLVPVLRGIGNALVALTAAAANKSTLPRPIERPDDLPSMPTVEHLTRALDTLSGPVPRDFLAQIFTAYGIPLVPSSTVTELSQAIAWAQAHRFPLALKVDSPDIAHRSDIGAVITDIRNVDDLKEAWEKILANVQIHRPDAVIAGLEVQEQIVGCIEAFTGFVTDARIGTTIGLGMGGTLVELLDDTARALAPISAEDATSLLKTTRLQSLLDGYRNLNPMTPAHHFTDVVSRLSWMADDLRTSLREADLNPVLVEQETGRVFVIDALLVAGADEHSQEALSPAECV
ncbi:acetate--CoA ligase family protein [Okibacterium endophyticum]